jgi:iron-sulfur cluster assembly accessory protein
MARTRRSAFIVSVFSATVLLGCEKNLPSETVSPARVAPPVVVKAVEPPLVTVTPKAARAINQNIAGLPEGSKLYLRVRVVPGGCQGFMHKLDLDPAISDADRVWESEGISVVASARQVEMLRGTRVDFGEENGQQGFKIENPNFKGEATKKWLALLENEKDVE